MVIKINKTFMNWNEYINKERSNKYWASSIKKKEKEYIKSLCLKPYDGDYPVEVTFKKHFKDHRQDLDNLRVKGLLDGLVASGVLKNDNLRHINKIVFEAFVDGTEILEIEIKGSKK